MAARAYGLFKPSSAATPIVGAYDALATVTVGSTALSAITFTGIPSTYTHLQIRGLILPSASGQTLYSRTGSGTIDTGANYSVHSVYGQGSSAGYSQATSQSTMVPYGQAVGSSTSAPTAIIIDYVDYSSTTKTKVIKSIAGNDLNGSGEIGLYSNAWYSTNPITTINFYMGAANFAQYSSFSLYGVR